MASTLNIANLGALSRNHSSTVAGQMTGLKVAGTNRMSSAWSRVCAAVKSSRIGTWFMRNPLKGCVIGGAALDGAFETVFYIKSSKDYKKFTDSVNELGYNTLLIDLSEHADAEAVEHVLDCNTTAKRSAAWIESQFSDPFIQDNLGAYLGQLEQSSQNFIFTTDTQAKVDVLCMAFLGLGVTSLSDLRDATAEDVDAFVNNALDTSDLSSTIEVADALAADYETLRNPLARGKSRFLDFQTFLRMTLLNAAAGVNLDTVPIDSNAALLGVEGLSGVISDDNGNSRQYLSGVSQSSGAVDLNSLMEDAEAAGEIYE